MKASRRIVIAFLLGWAGSPLLAQNNAAPPPDREVIGNPQIQDFSLNGTVTRRAEPQPSARTPAGSEATPPATTIARPPVSRQSEPARPAPAPTTRPSASEPAARQSSQSLPATPDVGIFTPAPGPSAPPSDEFVPVDSPPSALDSPSSVGSDDDGPSIWPWILAMAALAAGIAYYFRYLHDPGPREALAGVPSARESMPERGTDSEPLARRPVATPQPPASGGGIVSSSLRPWLDLELAPARLILTEEGIAIECQAALYNNGAAPARDVRIDARIVNAGATQDQDLEAYFAYPEARNAAASVIEPLNSATLPLTVRLPLDQLRMFQAADRQFFIPLVAINVSYRGGQTSAAWLIGRDNNSEKLAPFRVDLGARQFRGLAARRLQLGVRK